MEEMERIVNEEDLNSIGTNPNVKNLSTLTWNTFFKKDKLV